MTTIPGRSGPPTAVRDRPHAPTSAAVLRDQRGLTALGGALLAVGLALVGLGYDLATGTGLREAFAVSFIGGCAAAVLAVHREDIKAMVVMPPLAYLALSVTAALLQHAGSGSVLGQQLVGLANTVVLGAPVLISATAVAGLLGLARGVLGRAG